MSYIEGVFDQEVHENKYVHHNTQGCDPRHCREPKSLQMLDSRGQHCSFGFLVTQTGYINLLGPLALLEQNLDRHVSIRDSSLL